MRIEALMIRIFKEMLRDKRTLALMFIAPLFIMTLIFFLFQSNTTTKVDLAVHGVQTSLTKAMDTKHLRLHHVGTEKPTRIIKQHDYAAFNATWQSAYVNACQHRSGTKHAVEANITGCHR